MNNGVLLFFVIIYALTNATGLYLMKNELNSLEVSSFLSLLASLMFRPAFYVGFGLYACGFLIFLRVLSKGLLNVTLPIFMGAGSIGVFIVSIFALQEPFTWRTVVGIMLIGIGSVLLQNQV